MDFYKTLAQTVAAFSNNSGYTVKPHAKAFESAQNVTQCLIQLVI